MDRLVEDSDFETTLPSAEQIKILERCLQYLNSCNDNLGKKEVGWLLLARVLERCNEECLRAGQVRLAKRLCDIYQFPTLASAIFVRQLLTRNPKSGELYNHLVEKTVLTLFDTAVRDDDDDLKEIAADIFSLRYGCSKSSVLLQTLETLLKERLIISGEDRAGLINISCLGMAHFTVPLIRYMFDVLSCTFEHARMGELLERDRFLAVVETGLKNAQVRDSALGALSAFCDNAKSAALPVVPLIVSMLVSQLSSPSPALFRTLQEVNDQFGAASTLHKHLFVIFSALKHPLGEQEYGKEAGNLLSSIVRSSSFLVQPEILSVVQKAICNQVVRDPSSPINRSVLLALLYSTHPLVPVPVHVARTVAQRFPDENLSAICDTICRPRILNLDTRRALEKAATAKLEAGPCVVAKEEAMEEETTTIDEYKKEVNKVMEEIQRATEAKEAEEEEGKEEPTPSTSAAPPAEGKKRPTSEDSSAAPKKKKKAKKAAEPAKTLLAAGEESVDDIMGSFCL